MTRSTHDAQSRDVACRRRRKADLEDSEEECEGCTLSSARTGHYHLDTSVTLTTITYDVKLRRYTCVDDDNDARRLVTTDTVTSTTSDV